VSKELREAADDSARVAMDGSVEMAIRNTTYKKTDEAVIAADRSMAYFVWNNVGLVVVRDTAYALKKVFPDDIMHLVVKAK